MSYHIKEIYFTLQGEGAQTGRAAVFCRFTGCNLWSGQEQDRSKAICQFCDTDFVGTDGPGGGTFSTPQELAQAIAAQWPPSQQYRLVVCTGGEPLLQINQPLLDALQQENFLVAIETNGTIQALDDIDWICVSPKANTELIQVYGDELKLVFPQPNAMPEQFAELEFDHYFLQPMDGPHQEEFTQQAIAYCKQHPQWRLSLQTHKLIGIP